MDRRLLALAALAGPLLLAGSASGLSYAAAAKAGQCTVPARHGRPETVCSFAYSPNITVGMSCTCQGKGGTVTYAGMPDNVTTTPSTQVRPGTGSVDDIVLPGKGPKGPGR